MALWDDLIERLTPAPDGNTTRMPTHYLGGAPELRRHRHGGITSALPRVPYAVAPAPVNGGDAIWMTMQAADRATQRRRRLLAIFGRLMARFYDHHERRWSMGRWECILCRERIVAWAWISTMLPEGADAMHESCVSSRMWEAVLYQEQLVRAGLLGSDTSLAGLT